MTRNEALKAAIDGKRIRPVGMSQKEKIAGVHIYFGNGNFRLKELKSSFDDVLYIQYDASEEFEIVPEYDESIREVASLKAQIHELELSLQLQKDLNKRMQTCGNCKNWGYKYIQCTTSTSDDWCGSWTLDSN